ncbi:unnamed protein product [Didymodactylos carnosus]|uniref:Uncharacterized protein n=1 Tax=Didymodactylos carnosus TaxID=1234261 RepID=A0A814PHE0_9BILA|nr:unnamed protein product [Didymodactylos carnosus]CAF1130856.1 unnamed protein product [Didymodactylos carnosus]CAF3871342.1 unnamed protein product [Didymodactylos carnosus]CAF3913708.1 unnamed protein product [Didymodactylos carnosus]
MPFQNTKNKQILHDITGIFKSGMNAILGPSGCGKSSLLDVLAARKDPDGLSGTVLIDGQTRPNDYKYRVGYVVQDDILSGTLTVKENLAFSANIRLSKTVSKQQKADVVKRVIHQLALEKCADTRVGLDSSTAIKVMKLLHEISLNGCTIIFSIHQPRYMIYKLFDQILLLSLGLCIYHGPAPDILSYFSESLGFICEQYDNPCDFLLDIVQGDRHSSVILKNSVKEDDKEEDKKLTQNKLAETLNNRYLKSYLWASVQQETDNYFNHPSSDQILYEKLPKKCRFNELYYVSQRVLRNLGRSPTVIIIQIGVSIVFAILCGLVFLRIDHTLDQGVRQRAGALFLITTFQVFVNLISLELFLKEPTVDVFAVANVILGMIYLIMMIFSGFIVDLTSIVAALNWLQWFSIFRYALYGLNINEFTNLNLCATVANNTTSICSYRGEDTLIERHIDFESDWDLWKNFLALGIMTIIYLILTYIQLLRIKKYK